jgi:hypothetical protein
MNASNFAHAALALECAYQRWRLAQIEARL